MASAAASEDPAIKARAAVLAHAVMEQAAQQGMEPPDQLKVYREYFAFFSVPKNLNMFDDLQQIDQAIQGASEVFEPPQETVRQFRTELETAYEEWARSSKPKTSTKKGASRP